MPCRELETDLVKLIKEGQVAGRIDSHAGVLYARKSDARQDSFRTALAAGVACAAVLRPISQNSPDACALCVLPAA